MELDPGMHWKSGALPLVLPLTSDSLHNDDLYLKGRNATGSDLIEKEGEERGNILKRLTAGFAGRLIKLCHQISFFLFRDTGSSWRAQISIDDTPPCPSDPP